MLKDNLKNIRLSLELSQDEMAKTLDMHQVQYGTYERGKSKPSADVLEKLVLKHNVNINYLLTGEGPMFITPELSKNILQFKIPKNSRVLLEVED